VKGSIRQVEVSVLEIDKLCSKRREPDCEVENYACVAVVSRVVVRIRASGLEHLVVLQVPPGAVFELHSHGFPQVPVGGWIEEVEVGGFVVGQDPGEHGVLHQVVGGAARQPVHLGQVLEVGEAALLPQPGDGGQGRTFIG